MEEIVRLEEFQDLACQPKNGKILLEVEEAGKKILI